jgi:hypothetical protein
MTLNYEVFLSDPPPQSGVLPNGEPKRFSPVVSTLVYGARLSRIRSGFAPWKPSPAESLISEAARRSWPTASKRGMSPFLHGIQSWAGFRGQSISTWTDR